MPFDAIRMGSSAAGTYEIERSLRFNNADNVSLTRTVSSSTAGTKATLSFWFKVSSLHNANNGGNFFSRGNTSYVQFYQERLYFGNSSYWVDTAGVFRDFSAWYHVTVVIDTTQGTAANRQKIYVNGVLQARGSLVQDPAQDASYEFLNGAEDYIIGKRTSNDMNYMGYMAEIHFADGQALDPTSFGKTDPDTGQWIPKRYGGSYGTNGFYLNFSDNSNTTATTLGKDSSGNGNNWTPNNFSVAAGTGNDSLEDTPTNNFCTLNPLVKPYGTNTFSQGALHVDPSNDWNLVEGTFVVKSGKWYWEQQAGGTINPYSHIMFGIVSHGSFRQNIQNPQAQSGTIFYYDGTGQKRINNAYTTYGDSYNATGDVIGTALDMDARTVTFYKNGTSQGAIDIDLANDDFLEVSPGCSVINATTATFNFGQRPFAHSAPANHNTLCTANIPEPTIKDGTKHFDHVLYTGNGGSSQTITGLDFQPNLTWFKARTTAGADQNWMAFDSVRGVEESLWPNGTWAEDSYSGEGVSAFNSNGVTIGNSGNLNVNNDTYIMWAWKESATAGFDIVSYAGNGSGPRTISHNLGVKPHLIICKNRDQTTNWMTYHHKAGAEKFLYINTAAAQMDDAAAWNDTEPTSSVFTVNADQMNNGNGDDIIAYVFSSVEGFSKFGEYIGNGSTDGTFVYTGFKPALLAIKGKTTATSMNWMDTARNPSNPITQYLNTDGNGDEGNYAGWDVYSNGFKLRNTGGSLNTSGQTYVYLAFAETSFKYSNAR